MEVVRLGPQPAEQFAAVSRLLRYQVADLVLGLPDSMYGKRQQPVSLQPFAQQLERGLPSGGCRV
ncbi:hypothetical protein XF14_13000 [Burkholderia gladioli]|nr:hypothetical protein XF14_13000 [Burkholderia gladioli]